MPGENCSILGCGTCRNQSTWSIFKIPSKKEEQWRSDVLKVILRYREMDASLRSRVDSGKLYVCERHYKSDMVVQYPSKKVLKDGAIPCLNLPVKSFESVEKPSLRSQSSIEKRNQARNNNSIHSHVDTSLYDTSPIKSFEDLKKDVAKSNLKSWVVKLSETMMSFKFTQKPYTVPKFELIVDKEMKVIARMFGWVFHLEYSVLTVPIKTILSYLETKDLCKGVKETIVITNSHSLKHHTISKEYNVNNDKSLFSNAVEDHYYRSPDCSLLVPHLGSCTPCTKFTLFEMKSVERKKGESVVPVKSKAPISATSSSRLLATIQQYRLENKELTELVSKLQASIEKKSVKVNTDLHDDLQLMFQGVDQRKISPFLKLFWEQQMVYLKQNPKQVRYHPSVIKFCLSLYAKSPAAYNHLRFDEKNGTGALILPSQRTLRDYRNYIQPKTGFNPDIVNDLTTKTKDFSDVERFVVLSFDEMKIQEDLVWNKHTGELVGFVDLGDENLNSATLDSPDSLATHLLVFHIKSVMNPLSFSFGCFATKGVSSYHIFPLFWRAVCLLELSCNLFVIATTSDGASPNRGFYKMHKGFVADDGSVVFRTPNIFAVGRFIYFFADFPHLLKTLRNNLLHSGSDTHSRFMFNQGCHMLWKHISEFFQDDSSSSLRLLPKLTPDHIYLTSYSKMTVKYAAQVLSSSVGKVLLEFGPKEAKETANFCLLVDKFFDCGNVRNPDEHKTKRKPFLKPYSSVTDERFDWLKNVFLKYFEDWLDWINQTHPEMSPETHARMFISWQTYEGIQINVQSLTHCVKYLLNHGLSYVLTEKFCQDDLENYFGKQRSLGRRRDNPNMQQCRINDNIIKSSFSVAPNRGNSHQEQSKWSTSDKPLPKKARK